MAKGPEKNTKNKALHTKLLNRKKAKLRGKGSPIQKIKGFNS